MIRQILESINELKELPTPTPEQVEDMFKTFGWRKVRSGPASKYNPSHPHPTHMRTVWRGGIPGMQIEVFEDMERSPVTGEWVVSKNRHLAGILARLDPDYDKKTLPLEQDPKEYKPTVAWLYYGGADGVAGLLRGIEDFAEKVGLTK